MPRQVFDARAFTSAADALLGVLLSPRCAVTSCEEGPRGHRVRADLLGVFDSGTKISPHQVDVLMRSAEPLRCVDRRPSTVATAWDLLDGRNDNDMLLAGAEPDTEDFFVGGPGVDTYALRIA